MSAPVATPSTDDEAVLVERAVAGDRAAFERLYRLNVSVVFGYVSNHIGHDNAEDLTAETFCRAFQHIGRYEQRGLPFRAWLLRISYNLVVARSRSRSSTEQALEPSDLIPSSGHEDDILQRLTGEQLRAAMTTLTVAHQTVLDLRFLKDLPVAEAGEVLDLSDEAVRSLTYRALKALHRAYLGTATKRPSTSADFMVIPPS